MNDSKKKLYKNYAIHVNEKEEVSASTISKNKTCNYTAELTFLIKKIPNWEIYLNDHQIKLVKLYLGYKSISDVAKLLDIPYGSVYSAIFGCVQDEQGIYGKLKRIYGLITRNNNSNDLGSILLLRQEVTNNERYQTTEMDYKTNLFKYINALPDWRDYLTEHQVEIVELYIKYKSYSKVDQELGKASTWGTLYGKTKLNPKGVYKRLEKAYNQKVNNVL